MVEHAKDPVKAADSVFDKLKNHDAQGAAVAFHNEILSFEKAGGNVAGNEAKFLKELATRAEAAKQNDQLKKLGFPEVEITQSGEQIRVSFNDNRADGSMQGQDVDFDFTQYTRKHQTSGAKELHSADIKIEEPAKPAQPMSSGPEVAHNSSNALNGNVNENHQLQRPKETHPSVIPDKDGVFKFSTAVNDLNASAQAYGGRAQESSEPMYLGGRAYVNGLEVRLDPSSNSPIPFNAPEGYPINVRCMQNTSGITGMQGQLHTEGGAKYFRVHTIVHSNGRVDQGNDLVDIPLTKQNKDGIASY